MCGRVCVCVCHCVCGWVSVCASAAVGCAPKRCVESRLSNKVVLLNYSALHAATCNNHVIHLWASKANEGVGLCVDSECLCVTEWQMNELSEYFYMVHSHTCWARER